MDTITTQNFQEDQREEAIPKLESRLNKIFLLGAFSYCRCSDLIELLLLIATFFPRQRVNFRNDFLRVAYNQISSPPSLFGENVTEMSKMANPFVIDRHAFAFVDFRRVS